MNLPKVMAVINCPDGRFSVPMKLVVDEENNRLEYRCKLTAKTLWHTRAIDWSIHADCWLGGQAVAQGISVVTVTEGGDFFLVMPVDIAADLYVNGRPLRRDP